jgi:alpha-methylacyl-CoA racemase
LGGDPGKDEVGKAISTRTRDEWVMAFEGKDACVAPVLTLEEAPRHHHNRARETFIDLDGVIQPGPAPRFSGSERASPSPPRKAGADGEAILQELGYSAGEIDTFRREGTLL